MSAELYGSDSKPAAKKIPPPPSFLWIDVEHSKCSLIVGVMGFLDLLVCVKS